MFYYESFNTPPPLSAWGGGGVEPPTQFSKMGGLTGPQFLEGVAEKEGVLQFSRGVAIFTEKINLNLKYLMTKKVYKQKYFSLS